MIKIYIDWNVISQMKNGQHPELNKILENDDLFLKFYSTSHISDIFSSYKESDEQKKQIDSDLEYISRITKNRCLYNILNGKIIQDFYDPRELFGERVAQKDVFEDISLDGLTGIFNSSELGKEFGVPVIEALKTLPLEESIKEAFENPQSAEMMNRLFPGLKDDLTMEGWFKYFNTMIKELNHGEGYKELRNILQESTNLKRDKIFNDPDPFSFLKDHYKKFGGTRPAPIIESKYSPKWFEEISNEYIQLDMHGYQEDKVKIDRGRKETFQNTTEDAFHAAFASTCDFYIINDNRAYKKTSKVYEQLHINTWVHKPDEFIDHYNNYLGSRDYNLHLKIFGELITSANYRIQITEDGKHQVINLPFYFFDFFNYVHIIQEEDAKQLVILSQNKPTNYFVTYIELKNLIYRLRKFFGPDFYDSGELSEDEFEKETWKKRIWKISENLTLRFEAKNFHGQLYFDQE